MNRLFLVTMYDTNVCVKLWIKRNVKTQICTNLHSIFSHNNNKSPTKSGSRGLLLPILYNPRHNPEYQSIHAKNTKDQKTTTTKNKICFQLFFLIISHFIFLYKAGLNLWGLFSLFRETNKHTLMICSEQQKKRKKKGKRRWSSAGRNRRDVERSEGKQSVSVSCSCVGDLSVFMSDKINLVRYGDVAGTHAGMLSNMHNNYKKDVVSFAWLDNSHRERLPNCTCKYTASFHGRSI